MAKNSVKLVSRFPAVKEAGHEAVRHAVTIALNAGEAEAEKRLESIDNDRGYELPIDIGQQSIGFQSGKIYYDHFYGKWFEYGTARWSALPFMRPAHRKMRKVFITLMGAEFEGWVRRRASVRR